MAKSFHDWISANAGSIDDASTFTRTSSAPELTNLQKRLLVANMLVPNVRNTDDVLDWLEIFCVCLDRNEKYATINRSPLSQVIGDSRSSLFYVLEENEDHVFWLNVLKQDILTGKIK